VGQEIEMSHSQVPGWTHGSRPDHLFRRFAFQSYGQTRAFLDELARLSEQLGVTVQNIGFGTQHVNVTIAAEGETLTEQDRALAERLGEIATAQPSTVA
jgi:4a-hydroxytetrahydrobiopterin dehydratase